MEGAFGKGNHAGASAVVSGDKLTCNIVRLAELQEDHPLENCFAHRRNAAVDWIAKTFRIDGVMWERPANLKVGLGSRPCENAPLLPKWRRSARAGAIFVTLLDQRAQKLDEIECR